MATYLSQPYQGSEYVSGVPLDLIAKVGMMKQMKYEQTASSIQNTLDDVGNLDIIKDSEKQYVGQRLKETTDRLNQFSGMDLSDSTVANQLKSYTTSLTRDPRLYAAVADTRSIRNNIAQLNEIKEKHPEQYASQNEAEFMEGINNYLNSPTGTRYSGQTYTPYYNISEDWQKTAKDIQNNPDIIRELTYYTGPDGKQYQNGEREIKQATKERIAQALMMKNDPRITRQMQIDYKYTLPNKTWQGAVQELQDQRKDLVQRSQSYKDTLAQGISDPQQMLLAKKMIESIEGDGKDNAGALKQLDGKIAEVRATGDPTKYYSFDKYYKDLVNATASTYAFEQRGKIDYDDMFMEDYKFQHQLTLEQIKASQKLNAKGTPVELENFQDSMMNTLANIETNPNHEANIDTDGFIALTDGFKNTNGSITVTLGQEPSYLELGKVLEANGIKEQDVSKIRGYSTFTNKFNEWKDKQPKERLPMSVGTAIAENSSLESLNVFGGGDHGKPIADKIKNDINTFLSSKQGQELAKQLKSETGLDVNNATDRTNIETYSTSPEAQSLQQFGSMLTKLRGQIKVRPMDGSNIFAGNDNNYYVKMQGLFTEQQIRNNLSKSEFKTLLDKGLIQETLNDIPAEGKQSEQALYAIPITRKVTKDMLGAYTNYMSTVNSGDNFYQKNLPGHQARFREFYDNIRNTRGLDNNTLIQQGSNVLSTLANKATSPQDINTYQRIVNEYNRNRTILGSSGSSASDIIQAKSFINSLIQNSQQTNTLQSNPYSPGKTVEPRKPGQTVGEYLNNPGNLKVYDSTDPIYQMFGGTDSGIKAKDDERGRFIRFPNMQTGYNAYVARFFGPTDGLYNSDHYQPTKTLSQAMKSYSGFKADANGNVIQGYDGRELPDLKNKQLKELTPAERDRVISYMLRIENNVVYNQLVSSGIIKS